MRIFLYMTTVVLVVRVIITFGSKLELCSLRYGAGTIQLHIVNTTDCYNLKIKLPELSTTCTCSFSRPLCPVMYTLLITDRLPVKVSYHHRIKPLSDV